MTMTADPIHRFEREALARAIRHEERIRRLMRVYGMQRKAAEEAVLFADRIDTNLAEIEEQEAEFAALCDRIAGEGQRIGTEDGSGAGAWLGVVVLLALFLAAVAAIRWAL